MTEIEARWLADPPNALCTHSEAPLEDPAPSYQHKRDSLVCWHSAALRPLAWPLPPVMRVTDDSSLRCRLFAQALLDGRVLPGFKGDDSPQLSTCFSSDVSCQLVFWVCLCWVFLYLQVRVRLYAGSWAECPGGQRRQGVCQMRRVVSDGNSGLKAWALAVSPLWWEAAQYA